MTGTNWPALRVEDWTATRETLHRWMQIVGKVRLAQAPMINHWWQVTFYVTPRGLTTSSMPAGDRVFEIEFDFCAHRLRVTVEGGERRERCRRPRPSPRSTPRSRTRSRRWASRYGSGPPAPEPEQVSILPRRLLGP